MLFQPQLSNKALAELCHRLAVETDSGIDIRRTWQRETDIGPRPRSAATSRRSATPSPAAIASPTRSPAPARSSRRCFSKWPTSASRPARSAKCSNAWKLTIVARSKPQRIFLGAIAWPMIELVFAIFVIGVLIWILGIVAQRNNGQPIDILGFGLVGTRGLIIYMHSRHRRRRCASPAVVVAVNRGMLWTARCSAR